MKARVRFSTILAAAALAAAAGAQAQDRGTFAVRHLLPETAMKATRASSAAPRSAWRSAGATASSPPPT